MHAHTHTYTHIHTLLVGVWAGRAVGGRFRYRFPWVPARVESVVPEAGRMLPGSLLHEDLPKWCPSCLIWIQGLYAGQRGRPPGLPT